MDFWSRTVLVGDLQGGSMPCGAVLDFYYPKKRLLGVSVDGHFCPLIDAFNNDGPEIEFNFYLEWEVAIFARGQLVRVRKEYEDVTFGSAYTSSTTVYSPWPVVRTSIEDGDRRVGIFSRMNDPAVRELLIAGGHYVRVDEVVRQVVHLQVTKTFTARYYNHWLEAVP